jgi:glycosyltransferase involved in cell wall biosynthesis
MTPVIVIPVYNEADAIAQVVAGVRRHAPVIVVDDGSSDASAAEATGAGADVVRHPRRRGKAAALRTGFAAARSRGASAVVTLDGDGQHAPDDVPLLLRAARETPDQLVVGNRLAEGRRFPRSRLNAMEVAAFFVEWVSALGMRDTQSGFRAYPLMLVDDVGASRGGFVFETEVLVAAARRGWRAREVIVSSIPSARRRSRFRPVRDGVAIGAYLAGQVLVRWGREMRPGAAGFGARPCWADGDSPERRRRVRAAALATMATPILLVAALVQPGLDRLGMDVVTPLVKRLFACDRLMGGKDSSAGRASVSLPGAAASLAPSRATRP